MTTPKVVKQTLELELYSPHSVQLELHNSTKRFRVAAWGRQSGKTSWALNECLKKAWENPGHTYWIISPTFEQAKGQYRRLVGMLFESPETMLKKNQTELRVKLLNHSEIFFKSGEVFDNLRGATLNGVVIDEVRDQNPDLWPMVVRPMLTTTQGWAAFIGTPNGFDHFYDLSLMVNKNEKNWAFFSSPSTANPLFTQDEFEAAKQTMNEAQFAQEIMAEFRDISKGKVYIGHGIYNQLSSTPFSTSDPDNLCSDKLPVVLGLDFNLNPMSWHLGQFDRSRWYWFDEVHLENSHTQEAAQYLIEHKLIPLRNKGLLRANPQIIICGDATGKAGQRAAAAQSDYDILLTALKTAGFSFVNQTPDSNPSVKDRIATMNTRLKAADGTVTFFYHPTNCPKLKHDFDRVVWKVEGLLDEGAGKQLTHSTDSVGYPVAKLSPLTSIKPVGGLKVIIR